MKKNADAEETQKRAQAVGLPLPGDKGGKAKRTKVISLGLTVAEKARLKAQAAPKTLSSYLRDVLFSREAPGGSESPSEAKDDRPAYRAPSVVSVAKQGPALPVYRSPRGALVVEIGPGALEWLKKTDKAYAVPSSVSEKLPKEKKRKPIAITVDFDVWDSWLTGQRFERMLADAEDVSAAAQPEESGKSKSADEAFARASRASNELADLRQAASERIKQASAKETA